jgi:hypothetical protein
MMACIGEPISWLRLEQFALAGGDARIREHVDACAACRHCLDEIQRDVVALPALDVPATRRRRWWRIALPAFGALAAAALILLLLRPRPERPENVVNIKGVGEVVVDVVRERAGTIRDDVRTFRAGDRWKVIVTCAPSHEVSLAVDVLEAGAAQADHPLAPAKLVCGNRIPLPGAFSLTGNRAHEVCAHVEDQARACLTLSPE